ncbi:helix-turn-helix domain-containing protein [Mycobacterium sp. 141]|uniref:helix-turn-helix domain-containing protein n=1 Tax=Mycobacterium sp. 141 TaxID=1120797 RepID=UPI000373D293|nr:helix-turn-helix domain-containing protein [Mycobacterium sp. 141]
MNLTEEQTRLALYAVSDLIVRRHLGGQPIPAGFYRFREQLDTSVRGSGNAAAQAQSTDEDLIDTAEAAEILNRSTRWVREIRSDLDGMNVSGRWVFRRQAVVEYAGMRGHERIPRAND